MLDWSQEEINCAFRIEHWRCLRLTSQDKESYKNPTWRNGSWTEETFQKVPRGLSAVLLQQDDGLYQRIRYICGCQSSVYSQHTLIKVMIEYINKLSYKIKHDNNEEKQDKIWMLCYKFMSPYLEEYNVVCERKKKGQVLWPVNLCYAKTGKKPWNPAKHWSPLKGQPSSRQLTPAPVHLTAWFLLMCSFSLCDFMSYCPLLFHKRCFFIPVKPRITSFNHSNRTVQLNGPPVTSEKVSFVQMFRNPFLCCMNLLFSQKQQNSSPSCSLSQIIVELHKQHSQPTGGIVIGLWRGHSQ